MKVPSAIFYGVTPIKDLDLMLVQGGQDGHSVR